MTDQPPFVDERRRADDAIERGFCALADAFPAPQPFRCGDTIEITIGAYAGERRLIACYDRTSDVAWLDGPECVIVTRATVALRRVAAADDAERAWRLSAWLDNTDDVRGRLARRLCAEGKTP